MQSGTNKNELKKIIFRAGILLIPVYLLWWIYIEYFPLNYNSDTPTRWYFLKKSLSEDAILPPVKYLFIGESRMNAGIDFKKIPKAYSFASGGSTPIEMYYIWKKYINHNPAPDTVFLTVSPRFLVECFSFWTFAVRSGFFNTSEMNEIIKQYLKNIEDTVLGDFPKVKYMLYKFNWPMYYQNDIRKYYLLKAKAKNEAIINDMKQRQGGRFHPGLKESCSKLNHETSYKNFAPSPLLDFYLKRTLNSIKSHNSKLIFLFMPMNESSYQVLYPEFKKGYEKYVSDIQNKFPKFKITHNIYSYPDSLFGDESHLNEKGKKVFTDSLCRLFPMNPANDYK